MNSATIQKTIQDRYQVLPEEIREIIDLNLTWHVIQIVSKNIPLSEEQQLLLENQILLTLLFFVPYSTFTKRIQEELDLDENVSQAVSTLVDEKLFATVDTIFAATDKQLTAALESGDEPLESNTGGSNLTESTILNQVDERRNDSIAQSTALPQPSSNTIARTNEGVLQTTNPPTSLEHLRTMEADTERVHGYGAYRQAGDATGATAPRPRDPLAGLPRYTNDEDGQ